MATATIVVETVALTMDAVLGVMTAISTASIQLRSATEALMNADAGTTLTATPETSVTTTTTLASPSLTSVRLTLTVTLVSLGSVILTRMERRSSVNTVSQTVATTSVSQAASTTLTPPRFQDAQQIRNIATLTPTIVKPILDILCSRRLSSPLLVVTDAPKRGST